MPRVSVLLCVYNGDVFLDEALRSILGQTFGDFELVVVDDGSTDRSAAIVEAHRRRDPRVVRVVNERNLGLIRSLNRGLAACRAELVARQDADDISEPRRLERQVEFLESRPDFALVGTRYDEIDEHGNLRGPQRMPFAETAAEVSRMRLRRNPFAHSSVMFRRKFVLDAGGYREQYRHAEDYDLWLRILESHKGQILPEVLLHRRITPGMISLRRKRELIATVLKVKRRYLREFSGADYLSLLRDCARYLKASLSF